MDQPSCPGGLLGKLWVISDVYSYQANIRSRHDGVSVAAGVSL